MSSALNRSEFIHSRGAFRAELSRVYIYTCQEGIRYVCINRHHFNTLLNYLYCRDLGKKSREIVQELGCCSLSLSITPCYYFVCIWHLWSIRVLNFKILLNLWKTTNQARVPFRRLLSILVLYMKHQWSTRDILFESYDISVIKTNQIVKYFLISSIGTQLWRLFVPRRYMYITNSWNLFDSTLHCKQ